MITTIDYIFNQIIPENDREHREGFRNEHIIDKLSLEQKAIIENRLISYLSNSATFDPLAVETIVYLKSIKALPLLYKLIKKYSRPFDLLIISASIFLISPDKEMIDVACESFLKMESKWDIIFAFRYLSLFKNEKTNNLIKKFTTNADYLISYNAKESYDSSI